MIKGSKVLPLLLITQTVTAAITTYSGEYIPFIAGLAFYVVAMVLTSLYVNWYTSRKEAPAILLLSSLATCIGALLGYIVSRSAYSAIVALGLIGVSATYVIVAVKIRVIVG